MCVQNIGIDLCNVTYGDLYYLNLKPPPPNKSLNVQHPPPLLSRITKTGSHWYLNRGIRVRSAMLYTQSII